MADESANDMPGAAPPPLAPVERVVEILERFFLEDARLTTELLTELGRCSSAHLVRLFRPSPADQAPAAVTAEQPAAGPAEPAKSALTWSWPGAEATEHSPEPRWDSTGKRLNPGQRAFDYPVPRVRGSHWAG
jgi:hypothetical protein